MSALLSYILALTNTARFSAGSRFKSIQVSKIRKMTSGTDHLTRTADITRQKVTATAEIQKIEDLSSTVKRLYLHVPDQDFSFKAGQWIDMIIPGVEKVGGFSMCSSPNLLVKTRILQLAIKLSDHPPAYWVHTQCQVGDLVKLKVGGDFYYDPQPHIENNDLLLLAGGVGINPLYSMLQHFMDLHTCRENSSGDLSATKSQGVVLLHSARNTEELIFKKELRNISHCFDNIIFKLYSTGELVSDTEKQIKEGRIQLTDIQWALSALDKKKTNVYICGPMPFIETMKSFCVSSDIQESRIFFEKWW